MGTAKMSRMSDDGNSSDDLIAELARLMADDARGEPAPAKPAPEMPARPAPRQASPAAPARPPVGTPPSERLNASRDADALYENDERPNEDHLGERPSPKFAPTFRNPNSRTTMMRESPADDARVQAEAARRQELEAEATAARKMADDAAFANRFRDTQPAPARPDAMRFDDSDMQFEELDFGNDPDPAPVPAQPRAVIPPQREVPRPHLRAVETPRQVETPSHNEPDDDPIGDLIAAQMDEEETGYTPAKDMRYAQDDAPQAEDDNFSIPPVFGLGNAAMNAEGRSAPKADPLDDIESLIGEAVRGGISSGESRTPQRREPEIDDEDVNGAATAAEAAIMAATTSMRREEVSHHRSVNSSLDDLQGDARSAEPARETKRRKSLMQNLAGPLIAATFLIAVGFGLYWVVGTGPELDADAPVLNAAAEPVKVAPETPAASTETPRSVVFDALDGNTAPGNTEQLVSRDQSGDVASANPEVSRIIGGEEGDEAGLANRKVRTVTVRPDGTIVSGEDTLAGSEALPVDRPDVPALPAGTETAATELAAKPILAADAVARLTGQTPATNEAGTPLVNAQTVPIPLPRPVNRPTLPTPGAGTLTTVNTSTGILAPVDTNNQAVDLIANLANQNLATPVATPSASTTTAAVGTAYVQLSSQRSPEAANQSLAEAERRFGNLLTGGPLEVQRIDLDDRGTFYRVRMPANSLETANDVCTSIKANGGDCFVRTN